MGTNKEEAKSTLVFAVDLAHVAALQEAFLALNIDARCITGATPTVQRQSDLQAFKARLFPVLINCGVLTEGTGTLYFSSNSERQFPLDGLLKRYSKH